MVQYCVVPLCINTAKSPGISFFSFPKDIILRKSWIIKIRRDERHTKITDTMRVCSAHFVEKDLFSKNGKRRCLQEGSVPSVFKFTTPTIENLPQAPTTTTPEIQPQPITINPLVIGAPGLPPGHIVFKNSPTNPALSSVMQTPRAASSMSANIKKENSSTVAQKAATLLKAKNAKHRAIIGIRQNKRYVPPPLPFARMGTGKKTISSDHQVQRKALKLAIDIKKTMNSTELEESSDTSTDDTLSADETKEAIKNEELQKKKIYKPAVIPLKSHPTTPVKVQKKILIKKPVRAGASILTSSINRPLVSHPGLVPNRVQVPNSNNLIFLAGDGSLNTQPANTTVASVTSSVSNVILPGLAGSQNVLVPLSNLFQMLPTTQNNPQFSIGTQQQMATGHQSVRQPSLQPAHGPMTVAYLMPSNSGQLTNYSIATPSFLAGPNQGVQTIVVQVTNPGQATPLSTILSSTPRMQASSNLILNTVTTSTSGGLVLKPQVTNRKKIPARFRKVLMDEAQVRCLEADFAQEQTILDRRKKLHEEQIVLEQKLSGELTVSTVDESAASISSKGKNSLQMTVSENRPSQTARKSFKSSFTSSKMKGLTSSISTLPQKASEKLKPTFASQKPMQLTTKPTTTMLPQHTLKSSTPQIAPEQEFFIQHQTADGQKKTFKLVKLPPNHPSVTALKNKIPQTLTTIPEIQSIAINPGLTPGFKNNPTNPALPNVTETVSLAIGQTTEKMTNTLLIPNIPELNPMLLPKSGDLDPCKTTEVAVMEEVLSDENNLTDSGVS